MSKPESNQFEPKMYVVEWLHEQSGDWMPLDASASLRPAQRMMRDWRERTKATKMHDKFRIAKYWREE